MKRWLGLLSRGMGFVIGVILFVSFPAAAEEGCPDGTTARLLDADQTFLLRSNPSQAKIALEKYLAVVQDSSSCVQALWKASKAAWWVGDQSDLKSERTFYFEKGIDLAKQALRENAQAGEAHFWLAVNYGSFGETKGIMKSLFLVSPIRKALREAQKYAPDCEGAGPTRVMGVVDYKVPGLVGGSKTRAEEELKKALEVAPTSPINLYYLAEYYDTVGNRERALDVLTTLKNLEAKTPEEEPEVLKMKSRGEILRQKINK